MSEQEYGLKKVLETGFDDAVTKVTSVLKEQGFGIITDIDMQATLKKKLDVDRPKYRILGACNPVLANKALSVEEEVGLLLPCNVILYEGETPDSTVVSFVNPKVMMQVSSNEDLVSIANEAFSKLETALANL